MTAAVDSAAKQMARFVVMYDTPSDVEAFERHYNDVHIPLAKHYPGLRRFTRSHEPAVVIGEPCYMVVMLDWDDMAALQAALGSEIGQRTAEGDTRVRSRTRVGPHLGCLVRAASPDGPGTDPARRAARRATPGRRARRRAASLGITGILHATGPA
jgi:uncharacterized protein (TIGR02118 family)